MGQEDQQAYDVKRRRTRCLPSPLPCLRRGPGYPRCLIDGATALHAKHQAFLGWCSVTRWLTRWSWANCFIILLFGFLIWKWNHNVEVQAGVWRSSAHRGHVRRAPGAQQGEVILAYKGEAGVGVLPVGFTSLSQALAPQAASLPHCFKSTLNKMGAASRALRGSELQDQAAARIAQHGLHWPWRMGESTCALSQLTSAC